MVNIKRFFYNIAIIIWQMILYKTFENEKNEYILLMDYDTHDLDSIIRRID
jgi:hypothetical protein